MRKFFCPFLIFILKIKVLSLVFSFSVGEEAGTPVSGDDHPIEEIVRAVLDVSRRKAELLYSAVDHSDD